MDQASQRIAVKNRLWRQFKSQPFNYGVPWPKGTLKDAKKISLTTERGKALPLATTVLNRWPDGSIQWTLLDFVCDLEEEQERRLAVAADGKKSPIPPNPVNIKKLKNTVRVSNGIVDLEIASTGNVVRKWTVLGKNTVEPESFDVVIKDMNCKQYRVSLGKRKVSVEHANPMRAVIRIDGKHETEGGDTLLDYWLKFTVTADSPDVKMTYHFRNREEPIPFIKVKTIQVVGRIGVPIGSDKMFVHTARGRLYQTEPLRVKDDFEMFAADCGDIDRYSELHVKEGLSQAGIGRCYIRQGEVLRDDEDSIPWYMRNLTFRGPTGGERACLPFVAFCSKEQAVMFCGGDMVGLHPKSVRITGNTLTYSIWPEWAGPLEITQGAGKTHDLFFAGLPARTKDDQFITKYLSWQKWWGLSFEIKPDIEWVRKSKVFKVHMLPECLPKENFQLERKIKKVFHTGPHHPAPANGMWNYGDTYPGGNNEEMVWQTFFQGYFRSGAWDLAERGITGCQHMIDVDYVDYSIYPAQHHGMPAHCGGHNRGAVYPSHEWFHELFMAYALTGNPEFKKTALNLCENLLYWINTPEEFEVVATDLRESGQPMIGLTYAYEFNPDQRYIDAMMKIFSDALVKNAKRFGRMTAPEPSSQIMIECSDSYGSYATNQGLFGLWEITGDDKVKKFYLEQSEIFVCEELADTNGFYRSTDYNKAAFAYYMSGDREWIDRIARAFRAAFRESEWPLGWQHSMYYMKLALDFEIVTDDDVLIQ